jgi:Fe-S cluster assembly ATP-binding protein
MYERRPAALARKARAPACFSRSSTGRDPGVNNAYLLKAGLNAMHKHRGFQVDAFEFLAMVREQMQLMHMDESFLNRGVNEGFGRREEAQRDPADGDSRAEALILDQTGLDIDALRVVANGVNSMRSPERAMVLVTHYQRLLDIDFDYVHVLSDRQILRSQVAHRLERRGYDWVRRRRRSRERHATPGSARQAAYAARGAAGFAAR